VGNNAVAVQQYVSIFIHLAIIGSQICEIPREFELIGYRSWILGVNQKRM